MNIRISKNQRSKSAIAVSCHFIIASAALSALSAVARADILAGWDFNGVNAAGTTPPGQLAVTTAGSNVSDGKLTLGSVTPSSTANTFGATHWGEKTSESAAATNNDVVTFTITANTSYAESFSSVSAYNVRRSSTGPSTGVWQYELGTSGFTDITAPITWGSSTASTGNSEAAITLSTVSGLQNVAAGTAVTFRIVNYGDTSTSGTWYLNDFQTGNDLIVNGSTAIVGNTTYWLGDDQTAVGGDGTWNTTNNNWSLSDTAISPTTYDGTKLTEFEGTPGTVTVSTVTASAGITFSTTGSGYTLNSGSLTLGGGTAAVNTVILIWLVSQQPLIPRSPQYTAGPRLAPERWPSPAPATHLPAALISVAASSTLPQERWVQPATSRSLVERFSMARRLQTMSRPELPAVPA